MGLTEKKLSKDYLELEEESNPGEKLRAFLIDEFNEDNFVDSIDSVLSAEGMFKDIVYKSSISYLIRRLIIVAHYFKKVYKDHGDGRIREEIRKHIQDNINISNERQNELLSIITLCLETGDDDFSHSDKHYAFKQVREYDLKCYICGGDMDLTRDSNLPTAATADHKWPKIFGGLSEIGNLRYACYNCNSKYKKDFIDYSDHHYEEIAHKIATYDEYETKIVNHYRYYEAAIFSKTNFQCYICNQPAYRIGKLYVGRINTNDAWHYLNLTAYCYEHKQE